MPFLLATPIPVKYDKGIDIAIAHGHDITRNVKPRYKASFCDTLNNKGRKIITKIANNRIIGV